MKKIKIKCIENRDTALSLVWNVFLEYEAPDYSEKGIAEFHKSIQDETYLQQLYIYGAYLDDILVGILATRNEGTHIALFFVDGKYHRQGIGRKLFETAKSNCNSEKMTVNSSPYAVSIYEKLGFSRVDTEQVVNGIRFTPMELKTNFKNEKVVIDCGGIKQPPLLPNNEISKRKTKTTDKNK